MPYGKGGRLGESIDPRLMLQDYSGYAKAGMIQGQTLANLGQQIGDVIKQRSDQKKRDAQNEKFLQQALDMFKGTDLEAPIGAAYQEYISEETTDKQRRAIGDTMRETIGLGLKAQEMRMAEAEMQMRQAAMRAKGSAAEMPISPAQIRAAYEMANAAGRGAPARALVQQYEMAKTPEEEQQIAQMLIAYSGALKPSTVKGESETLPKLTALDQRYDYLRRAYMLKTGKQELTPAEEANLREQAVRLDPMSVVMQQALSGLEDDL